MRSARVLPMMQTWSPGLSSSLAGALGSSADCAAGPNNSASVSRSRVKVTRVRRPVTGDGRGRNFIAFCLEGCEPLAGREKEFRSYRKAGPPGSPLGVRLDFMPSAAPPQELRGDRRTEISPLPLGIITLSSGPVFSDCEVDHGDRHDGQGDCYGHHP